MHYEKEQIKKFKLGVVVEVMSIPDKFGYRGAPENIGHVVGFSHNSLFELLILVQDFKNFVKPYPPSRLLVLE